MTNLQDFKLENGDILATDDLLENPLAGLARNFDVVFVSGNEATRQRLEQKFKLFFGEWFLDVTAGVRWFEDYLGKRPRPETLQFLLRSVVERDPGIKRLLSASFDLNKTTRELTIQFSALSVTGEIINDEVTI